MKKIIVLAFMVMIILGECVAGFIFYSSNPGPSAQATESHEEAEAEEPAEDGHAAPKEGGHGEAAEESGGHGEAEEGGHGGGGGHGGSGEHAEVDLGEYSVTVYRPSANTTLRVDFHLFGILDKKDLEHFNGSYEESKQRIRDHVLVTMRSSELSELADPGLGLIKRRILAKTNETLGQSLLKGVIFSDFSFIEH